MMQTKASHHLCHACSPLVGAIIRAIASHFLCWAWAYLIGATVLAEVDHCCAGLEGISERLRVCLKVSCCLCGVSEAAGKGSAGQLGWMAQGLRETPRQDKGCQSGLARLREITNFTPACAGAAR